MKKYETTFVIDSLIKSEEVESIISKVEKFITNNGGEILNVDRWGKKRLAYEIKKRQYGYYVLIDYKAPEHLNKNLEREYKLDENILRHLIVAINPRVEKQAASKKTEQSAIEKKVTASKEHDGIETNEPSIPETIEQLAVADTESDADSSDADNPVEAKEDNE